MLHGSQKRFDKNGDGKLTGAEWQRWYWRTFGDEIEAKERHRRNQAAEQQRAEIAAQFVGQAVSIINWMWRDLEHLEGEREDQAIRTMHLALYVISTALQTQKVDESMRYLLRAFWNEFQPTLDESVYQALCTKQVLFAEIGAITEPRLGSFWRNLLDNLPPERRVGKDDDLQELLDDTNRLYNYFRDDSAPGIDFAKEIEPYWAAIRLPDEPEEPEEDDEDEEPEEESEPWKNYYEKAAPEGNGGGYYQFCNGEGSIRKRKDGRWEGRYTAGYDKDGKVITKNVLGKTQAEVKEKLKTAIEESQKLDPTRTGQYTVQTWVTLWYEVFIKPQIRPNTKQFYRNCMENHLFPALGDCPLEKLSTIQIQRAINEMSEHGRNHYYSHIPLKETTLSPRIVQGILGILRKSLDQAVAEKLILSNPAANCKAPKTVRKEMKVLPEELIGPYLHEAKQRGVFAPLYLELTSGLRRGELLALLWKDLNVKNRTLSVTKSVCRIDHQLVVSQPKTKNSLRLLTLPESTVQILVEEHEKHPDNPYMFPSPKTGEMLDPASFRAMHDRILEAIGAEHVRFHDMRHTFATLALKNGVDVRTLSEMLGHYSAGFTLSTYVHSTPSMRVQAADTIGQMIDREVV